MHAIVLALATAATPAPEHSDVPIVASCLATADAPSDTAYRAIGARRFARASHLFAIAAANYDDCAHRYPQSWNPGDALFAADRILLAGQAAHLAGDPVRAKHLVEVALKRFVALERIIPQPESGFYQHVTGSRESAEDDLRGTWTIF